MKTNKRGFGVVEVMIGAAIILIGLVSLTSAYSAYLSYALKNDGHVQAAYLGEEALEVITYLRDQSWNSSLGTMSTSVPYYLNWTGSAWATTTTATPYIEGRFSRYIDIDPVYRDGTDKIVASGTLDPNTKKVVVTIAYKQGAATTTKTMTTYFTNLHSN